jgi:hypothetical protein
MKLLIPMSLALALSIAAMAQDTSSGQSSQSGQSSGQSSQSGQMGQSSQTGQTSQMEHKHKEQKMSGKVSSDSKTITTDSNKTYTVDNPDALKGQEGQQVSLVVALDPETNTVHVIQVQPPSPQ